MKLGALLWPQYTDWRSLRDTGELVDRLGYDSLWTWDHLYPIVGEPTGPIFEGYLTLAGWAEHTEKVRLGLMVGANTFRHPALVTIYAAGLLALRDQLDTFWNRALAGYQDAAEQDRPPATERGDETS